MVTFKMLFKTDTEIRYEYCPEDDMINTDDEDFLVAMEIWICGGKER